MENVELTPADIKNTLACILNMWKSGRVTEEAVGVELSQLRHKYESMLMAKAEPPKDK